MSLSLPLGDAGDQFVEQFIAYDTTSTKTLGQWSAVQEADRIIWGVIQTSDNKKVNLAEDGALSDGTLVLNSRQVLSAYDLTQNGQILRQTYLRYGGEVWKLSQLTDWLPKTGSYNLYYLTKDTNIGGLS